MKGLEQILHELAGLESPVVLATLVRVQGSTYRKPGARMLLGAEGPRTGVLSAGCLENDVVARVQEVLEDGRPRLLGYDLGSELDLVWGTGMGCEGRAEILMERIKPGPIQPWVALCGQTLARRGRGAMATVFLTEGDVAFLVGDRFVFDEDLHGMLPCDHALTLQLHIPAKRCLEGGPAETLRCEVQDGALEILVEPVVPPLALWIYGANESSRPLADLAQRLGWTVGVLDHRPALATAERFPGASVLEVGLPETLIAALALDARSAAVILAHVYQRDKEALAAFLKSGAAYVGLQGNRKRSAKLLQELQEEGETFTEAQLARLYAPTGLDLGAEEPEANALSILAEAQAVLSGRNGGHLRDRNAPIHG